MIYPRENAIVIGGGILLQKLYMTSTDDIPNLPGLDKAAPGSDVYCTSTQDVYILNGETGEWEVQ